MICISIHQGAEKVQRESKLHCQLTVEGHFKNHCQWKIQIVVHDFYKQINCELEDIVLDQ